ncbi:UDP-N-acetylmuramoyl-tripeptide--D-alanyl-D-alanine ligase [Prevotellaceae bacterium HUN156]|nr:UDP-N-acetylmuramoyl-tripeptide--D-alanyl-D-alanine ligase [Prevotellaceae bacterium HUN156]
MDIKELYKLYQQHPLITTDSRNCPEGSIFLALKGASFNGNQFAIQALEKGCSYAIVDEEPTPTSKDESMDDRLILVEDCLQTFKDLAREHRRQFEIPVVGITGTNGKTTTKELIRAVLAECYSVMATEGNFNNDVGVPKTLFRLDNQAEIAVVEMGASHPGDIKTLVETAEPNCGLITNVGRAHLQGFGSFEGVCQTKGELYDFLLAHDCPIFINRDNEYLMKMLEERQSALASHQSPDVYYYGQSDNSDILIRGEVVSCAPFLKFRWREQDADAGYTSEWIEVQTHLIGAYNLDNMLAAITIGYVNNIPFEQINHALENYVPSNNRSQMTVTEHNHLIVDAYNANPTSMAAAIDNFKLMQVDHKMAILGKMGELGDVSNEEHQQVVNMLADAGFDEVWLVGEEYKNCQLSINNCQLFNDIEEVKAAIAKQQPQHRYILIKGSNSVKLYQLPELL